MMAYGVWGRFVKAEFPHDQASALQNTLLKGLRDVVSGEPALQLWDLSRSIQADETLRSLFDNPDDPAVLQAIRRAVGGEDFRRGFDKYLAEWGFRCSGELTLTTPSFQERPGAVIAMLRYYSRLQGPSPRDALQQQQEQRLSETKRVMRELRRRPVWRWLPWPRKSLMARRLLRWTQQAVMCRERARLKQALLYSLLRRICLALGRIAVSAGKLEQPDDLLYLSTEEMEQFHAGGALFPDFADLIRRRREGRAGSGEAEAARYVGVAARRVLARRRGREAGGNIGDAGIGRIGRGSLLARARRMRRPSGRTRVRVERCH